MVTVSVDVGYVDVDVDLEDFDDDDLIEELRLRDYVILDSEEMYLSREDAKFLKDLIDNELKPSVGSQLYSIREKLNFVK